MSSTFSSSSFFSPPPSSGGAHSEGAFLSSLGLDADREAEFAPYLADGLVAGRVSRVDRSTCDVVIGDGRTLRAGHGGGALPCPGDWAAVAVPGRSRHATPDDEPVVAALLGRRTALTRSSASGRSEGQALAVNVDAVLIVAGLDVEPDLGRIERLLTLAWDSGAQPVVVLTKADTVDDADQVRADVEAAAPGADVLVVSAVTGEGVDVLAATAAGRTVALIGTSGAGKSTLAAVLTGADLATGGVRQDGKGRHTTTWRELVPLPGGGVLVDTPGLRGVGLFDVRDGLDRTFADVEQYAERCRFADCGHDAEPGCAVLAAVDTGELPRRRLDSYRKLRREADWIASRTDHRLRAERARQWKVIHKEMRRNPSPKK
ncbi:ribosome small subunit-dependent GTPase A [Yinghuangia sp. ASG 101]|uniref:ribosome small subunit-dependent GTPase A n=1 Tax=Yinghuangia sp. ASG 101 TaxID=2896848 RepID=UPI001E4DACEF|nr:ribosome small subunit-dependent GTPase A [Yinghuangia sp. ASG 101]UGQ13761.1 ribosome small subunit-dependent GTPase A [Yinghuangia sp. ASG 101]